MYRKLKADPGKITILAVGPLTNVAQLLTKHPDAKAWIKRIAIMGGCVRTSEAGKPAIAEWNIKLDPQAAQTVFASGIPLVVAPLDATYDLKLDAAGRKKIFDVRTQLNFQMQNLYQLWDKETPILYDVLAAALCFTEKFTPMEDLHLTVDDRGMTVIGKGKPNARVAMAVKRNDFLKWYVDRMATMTGKPQPKVPVVNPSKLVNRGGRPTLVQVTETCETDIEKRWWMSGKLDTKNVPPDRKRVCRGVLTEDFDGRKDSMYTAVIFNPVPGPPVGKNPRITFRFWIKGSDQLRVQIYSLSNGYHRCLTVTGLPQGSWQEGCVDMTHSRKLDGTGGPLGDTDRIDDIQFYTDPGAELYITDIVLYDAAPAEEKRPFPKKIIFTGWFDTGRQGKDWPGSFAIVEKKPLPWKCAKSVPNPKGDPWIQLNLRGERPLGETTQLFFRYKLTGGDSLKVLLMNRTQKEPNVVELKNLKMGEWTEITADFDGKLQKGDRVDEVQFLLPKSAELLLDDVLLYEPRKKSRSGRLRLIARREIASGVSTRCDRCRG